MPFKDFSEILNNDREESEKLFGENFDINKKNYDKFKENLYSKC